MLRDVTDNRYNFPALATLILDALGKAMNSANDSADSIREINLSYIMLAQKMLRTDRALGEVRLGLSIQVANILADLTMPQVVRLAAAPHLLCAFRFNDHSMLSSLSPVNDQVKVASAEPILAFAK